MGSFEVTTRCREKGLTWASRDRCWITLSPPSSRSLGLSRRSFGKHSRAVLAMIFHCTHGHSCFFLPFKQPRDCPAAPCSMRLLDAALTRVVCCKDYADRRVDFEIYLILWFDVKLWNEIFQLEGSLRWFCDGIINDLQLDDEKYDCNMMTVWYGFEASKSVLFGAVACVGEGKRLLATVNFTNLPGFGVSGGCLCFWLFNKFCLHSGFGAFAAAFLWKKSSVILYDKGLTVE